MNTLKSVYNRLFAEDKVELASERVELGSLDDFQKALQNVKNLNGNAYNKSKTAKPILEQALKEYQMVKPSIERTIGLGMKIEEQAKQLGFDLPPDYKSAKERLFNEEKSVREGISKVEQLIKGFNF